MKRTSAHNRRNLYHLLWPGILLSVLVPAAEPASVTAASDSTYTHILHEEGRYSCLSPPEAEILRLVNEYRTSHGLPEIPHSRSLTKVARIHAIDLARNFPARGTDSRGQKCNLHSWSNRGFWTPVCYTDDHFYADLTHIKPREITGSVYWDVGYENAYWRSRGEIVPVQVLDRWKRSRGHDTLILETEKWENIKLLALGVGVHKNVAVIWVGPMSDPLGPMEPCSDESH